VTGFEITIKPSNEEKITNAKEQTGPSLANILSGVTGFQITYKPPQVKIIKNGQTFTRVGTSLTSGWIREISIKHVDLSKLSSLLQSHSKLCMQLAHAHNGHRAFLNKDYPQAIREYFLIFEETGRNEETWYRSLRNAVSHVQLDKHNTLNELQTNFGITLQKGQGLDVDNPQIKQILYEKIRQFQREVGLYLQDQLKIELAKK
jgi:hypothetical protein